MSDISIIFFLGISYSGHYPTYLSQTGRQRRICLPCSCSGVSYRAYSDSAAITRSVLRSTGGF